MDKTRDVRRAKPSRFSSANTHVTTQTGSDFKKLRRDKVRRLSFVDRVCNNTLDSEMPCVQSDDEEDEYHPCTTKSKRIKLPRKIFDDCQKVDHSSVPRKLRSGASESIEERTKKLKKIKDKKNKLKTLEDDYLRTFQDEAKELEHINGLPKDWEEKMDSFGQFWHSVRYLSQHNFM